MSIAGSGSVNFFGRTEKIVLALVFNFIFASFAGAVEYHDGEIKTNQATLEKFKNLVKGTDYELSPEKVQQRELKFAREQTAHILRVSELGEYFLDDPKVAKEFPKEVQALKAYRLQTLEQSLKHDGGKFLEETKFANEGLSRAQGMNMRRLLSGVDPFLPPEKAKQAGRLIKTFVDDVNVGEARVVNDGFKKLSPNPEFERAHSLMTAVNDWYDAAINRNDIGANRKGARAWISKLQKEGAFKGVPLEDLKFMKRYAEFLDTEDPLRKQPWNFTSARSMGEYSDPQDYKKVFKEKSEKLLAKAQKKVASLPAISSASSANSSASSKSVSTTGGGADGIGEVSSKTNASVSSGSHLSSSEPLVAERAAHTVSVKAAEKVGASLARATAEAAKGTAVVGGAVVGYQYLKDPEKVDGAEVLATVAGANSTAECSTLECIKFINKCAGQLKAPPGSTFDQIREHDDFEKICVQDFLHQPLNEQAKAREDADLDKILSHYAPAIRNLVCEPGIREIQVELTSQNQSGNFELQKFVFDSDRKVQKIERLDPNVKTKDILVCAKSSPQVLQHCSASGRCENYDMKKVMADKKYFWIQNRSSQVWAQQNGQLVQYQAEQIHKCCAFNSCHQFFHNRMEAFHKVQDRQVTSKSHPLLIGEK